MSKRLIISCIFILTILLFVAPVANAEGFGEVKCHDGTLLRINAWAEAHFKVFEGADGLLHMRWTTILNKGAYLSGITIGIKTTGTTATAWVSNGDQTLSVKGHVNYDIGTYTPFGFVGIGSGRLSQLCTRTI